MRAQVVGGLALSTAVASACNLLVSPEGLTGGRPATITTARDSGVDGTVSGDATVGASLDAGLVGYWSFDEGQGSIARDQSLFRNDAILDGVTWGDGRYASALLVDTVNGGAKVDESPSLSLVEEVTIACWVNLEEVSYDQRILAKRYAWGVKLNSRYPQLELSGTYATWSTPVPAGEWHHVAFTFARGEVHGYYDGAETELAANVVDAGETLQLYDAGFVIGNSSDFESPAKGRIDEVRIYSRALTAGEIAELAR